MSSNFSDLLLLIGTNPLPNLIVAKYFLKYNSELKRIWLIHSEKRNDINQKGTYREAENLKKLIQNQPDSQNISFEFVSLSNVSRAKSIEKNLTEQCIDNLSPGCSLNLNYTGGTKVMGTHIYRIIEKTNKIKRKSFSYLDARSFRIIDDEEDIITEDLRDKISISFQDIIDLHGFNKKSQISEINFTDAIEEFRKLISRGQLKEYFDIEHGYNRNLFLNKYGKGGLAEKKKDLDMDRLKKFIPNKAFLSIIKSLPEDCRLFDATGEFIGRDMSNRNCKDTIKFLDGGWLEDYLYKIFKSSLKDKNIEIQRNRVISKDGWPTTFELDIVLVKGYQLIGISCTTANEKKLCKSKGFEIILRARQIGGDEGKAILICCAKKHDRETLEKELQLDTGSGSNIIVLGIDDLEEKLLLDKVQDFISD
ncbi:MAG TPA: DUF1887 family CARF protein [Candidatus Eremiobacteraeota bacterium]|nr:MAG: hypothetical protein BWY64_01171 [bacterium ADurb.Bin363]HPZ07557.1 DUF1887 family CARF protein [Candidatus Eremiobacteraeota bacterium]